MPGKKHFSSKMNVTVFNPHTLRCCDGDPDSTVAIFIDPGTVNCGIRVVRRAVKDGKIKVSPLFHELVNFAKSNQTLGTSFNGATDFLSGSFRRFLNIAHYIIIERQMSFNYNLTRMSQHLISVMSLLIKDTGCCPVIIEMDSKLKSRTFLTKGETVKKSGIIAAKRILEEREDYFSLEIIEFTKKKDDVCDVVCYDELLWSGIIEEFGFPKVSQK